MQKVPDAAFIYVISVGEKQLGLVILDLFLLCQATVLNSVP